MPKEKNDPLTQAMSKSPEHAYEVIGFRETWGLLSLFLFFLSLTTPYIIRFLPLKSPGFGRLPPGVFLAVIAVPILSSLGVACSLLAGRKRTTTGRIGFFLNATVLAITGVLVLVAVVLLVLN